MQRGSVPRLLRANVLVGLILRAVFEVAQPHEVEMGLKIRDDCF